MSDLASLTLHVEARELGELFDGPREPSFPYTGRMVDERLARYLENLVRERRRVGTVELEVVLRAPSGNPTEDDAARRDVHAFFATERQLAELELRVNQREGWGFARRAAPLLIVALLVAGILYAYGPLGGPGPVAELVTALTYLLFITIVWVLLWDPIEKLLFDAYLLQSRIRALARLEEAPIRFVAKPASASP